MNLPYREELPLWNVSDDRLWARKWEFILPAGLRQSKGIISGNQRFIQIW
jgi:hypothetical protein